MKPTDPVSTDPSWDGIALAHGLARAGALVYRHRAPVVFPCADPAALEERGARIRRLRALAERQAAAREAAADRARPLLCVDCHDALPPRPPGRRGRTALRCPRCHVAATNAASRRCHAARRARLTSTVTTHQEIAP